MLAELADVVEGADRREAHLLGVVQAVGAAVRPVQAEPIADGPAEHFASAISVIILLCLDVRAAHTQATSAELCVPEPKNPSQMMGAAAGFHRNDAGRELRGQAQMVLRCMRHHRMTLPEPSSPATRQLFLPRSMTPGLTSSPRQHDMIRT